MWILKVLIYTDQARVPNDKFFLFFETQKPLHLWTFSETLHPVALVLPNVSENILPPSSGILVLISFHSGITVENLLLDLSTEGHY
jgi:hypothetical protein